MIEPSESARRIESAFQRFGVPPLAGGPSGPDGFTSKKGLGLALPGFIERMRDEIDGSSVSENAGRMLKLRLKQLEEVAAALAAAPAHDRFEAEEIALLASFVDILVIVFGAAAGKEYRAESA